MSHMDKICVLHMDNMIDWAQYGSSELKYGWQLQWQNWYRTVCMSHIEYRYIEAKNQIAYTETTGVYQSIDFSVLPQKIMALTWCHAIQGKVQP